MSKAREVLRKEPRFAETAAVALETGFVAVEQKQEFHSRCFPIGSVAAA